MEKKENFEGGKSKMLLFVKVKLGVKNLSFVKKN